MRLKACIAKRTVPDSFPDKKFAQDCYTHDLAALIKLARLDVLLQARLGADRTFDEHWTTVNTWNEQARYRLWSEPLAREMVLAINDPNTGVLPWIKGHW